MLVRGRLDQHDIAALGLNEQQAVGQDDLPVSVATSLPAALAGLRIEADEYTVIEAVD